MAEKRARYYRGRTLKVKEIDLAIVEHTPITEGQIVYYRDSKEGDIYAIKCELYDDGELIEQTKVKKCLGLSARRLKRTITEWVQVFNASHRVKIYWREMDMPVKLCPLWIEEHGDG